MKKTTTRIKTARELTQNEIVAAVMESLPPIFEHFVQKLAEKDGQALCIQITAKDGKIRLGWDVGECPEEETAPNP